MAPDAISPPNSQDPPEPLLLRNARIGIDIANTLRLPADSFGDNRNAWFNTGAGMPRVTEGNEVKYLIDGKNPAIPGLNAFPELSTFPDFIAAIRTATGKKSAPPESHSYFIYMLNWWFDDSFIIPSNPPQSLLNMEDHLKEASRNGVMIRAMFWDYGDIFNTQNSQGIRHIKDLFNGAAILDSRANATIGSMHQKVLCVLGDNAKGENELISFCGGIDFNRDRIYPYDSSSSFETKGSPLHDVHCRIRGQAALDVLQTFIQRWNSHPEGVLFNRPREKGGKGAIIGAQAKWSVGPHIVQIGRTFGRVDPPYNFAPTGETTAREIIRHAIRNAKRFIYTEDQYFVGNPEVEADLITALRKGSIKHLTILLTHWRISDFPMIQRQRHQFIDRLFDAGGDRVRVFSLQTGPDSNFVNGLVPHTYVHAKTWIFDDEFAVIGTLNTNHRCWSYDNEIAAGIYDTSLERILTFRLAHWLRVNLWQEHLNMPGPMGAAELADGVASAVHWLYPPTGARVKPYNWREPGDIPLPVVLQQICKVLGPDWCYRNYVDPENKG